MIHLRAKIVYCAQLPYETVADVPESWVWGRFGRVLPARSWEMPVERELPAKIGRCYQKLLGHNFDRRAKSS